MLNSRQIKKAIEINPNQYDRSRLYPLKNDGYKLKLYEITSDVCIFKILKNIQNCDILNVYKIDYEISENVTTRDLTLVFEQNTSTPYGLKDIVHDFDQHINEAAYYLAEKRGFAPGFEMEDWLKAKQQVFLSYGR
jgi:hypothetical protein